MNQNLLQKLRRVKRQDIIAMLMFFAAIPAAVCFKILHKNLWIFSDSPNEARDNGYWLYKYVKETHPEKYCIFALNKTSPDYCKLSQIGNIVPFGSYLHWVYYLSADNIIGSHKASGPNATVCYVLERFNLVKGNKIFLQHGIIKDKITFLFYKYTHIRLFTCSTSKELNYVRENYGYPKDNVQLLGLCRFDQLLISNVQCGKILVMPTWRKWLSVPSDGIKFCQLESFFLKSIYFKSWLDLMNSQDFIDIIERNQLTIVFYLHRESQRYSHFFKFKSTRIKLGVFPDYDVQELLKKSSFLITDYSSVAMDFAYMDKPLLYYQFDYDDFRKGHLEEGYFNYKNDGFGPVCCTKDEVIKTFESMQNTAFKVSNEYQERRTSFFTLRDRKNCQRTYQAISHLSKKEKHENN